MLQLKQQGKASGSACGLLGLDFGLACSFDGQIELQAKAY